MREREGGLQPQSQTLTDSAAGQDPPSGAGALTRLEQTGQVLRVHSLGQHPLDQAWVKLVSGPHDGDVGDEGDLVDRAEKGCSWNRGRQGGGFPSSCLGAVVLLFGIAAGLGEGRGTGRPLQQGQLGVHGGRSSSVSARHGVEEALCKDPSGSVCWWQVPTQSYGLPRPCVVLLDRCRAWAEQAEPSLLAQPGQRPQPHGLSEGSGWKLVARLACPGEHGRLPCSQGTCHSAQGSGFKRLVPSCRGLYFPTSQTEVKSTFLKKST